MADDSTSTFTPDAGTIAVGQLFQVLAGDPKYRTKVLSLIKEAAPDVSIPELDLPTHVESATKPLTDKLDGLEKQVKGIATHLAKQQFQSVEGLTDEELVEVETLAKDKKIGDAATAVEFWRQKQALGTPRATTAVTALSKDDQKEMRRNPKAYAFKVANRMIDEMRLKQRRGA